MQFLDTGEIDFRKKFDILLKRGHMDMDNVSKAVADIIFEIKIEGDVALMKHVAKFDQWEPSKIEELSISLNDMRFAYDGLSVPLKESLQLAYERIRAYHEKLLPKSWLDFEKNGNVLGQKVTPVDRAGLYIPGGKAAYPSSLLMNAIPAIVAGVEEIIVCTPAPHNKLNHLLLAAMHLCGIKKAYKVGGASAIGAMAFGTQSIPKVDVVTGPGNIFVATAKKMVFGEVNIDMIAGPSEIGILADISADPNYLAIDMLSQAEHDEMASSILITPCRNVALQTREKIFQWLETLNRKAIAEVSVRDRAAIIVTKDMDEAVMLMNQIAPEHLEVMTTHPFDLLPSIKHAGAIFMGRYTPEPIGDYIAGPNHTLPTGGTARFYSPLGVDNFLKKSSIISMSEKGIKEIGPACAMLARAEGLGAHESSVLERISH
ncbi:MAG: histidinol dehydrogenase [Sulfurospirillaceae bacterium]|nr:histidinol dehydrogenase [Sulfurospirillaceae bacterium]MDD3463687.1 histidinol dehydrogenase [Sulfurospirillaceae bacterium]